MYERRQAASWVFGVRVVQSRFDSAISLLPSGISRDARPIVIGSFNTPVLLRLRSCRKRLYPFLSHHRWKDPYLSLLEVRWTEAFQLIRQLRENRPSNRSLCRDSGYGC